MNNVKSEANVGEGKYLYCVINNHGAERDLRKIGLEKNKVYVVSYKDIGVVVHNCSAKPYESKEEKKVKSWLFSHLYVIDQATKKFGTIVPFAFDTIIKGSEDNVKRWLSKEYPKLKNDLKRLKDKAEYDIQIFINADSISQEIENNDEEIQELKEYIGTKSKGIAHLLQKKLELIIKNKLRKKMEEYSKEYSKKIHGQIKEYTEGTKVQKIIKIESEKWEDKEMILNLSCLVHSSKVKALGNILEQIDADGLSVRFSGPWPPFNFVN